MIVLQPNITTLLSCSYPRQWHPENDRQIFYASNLHPESGRRALSPAPMLCLLPRHVPISIQRATDGSFAHPTSFQSGQRTLSPAPNRASSRPSCIFAIASQRSCHLPRSCPRHAPASDSLQRNRAARRPSHPFEIASQ